MMILLDTGPQQFELAKGEIAESVQLGQLLTPLTRYADRGMTYGIDNGAFSRFDADGFLRLLERQKGTESRCKFVAVPDVVGSAIRTSEVFERWVPRLTGWPLAYVAQDGCESLPIPWDSIEAVFIGGGTAWKLGPHAEAVVRAAKILGKWVHIGRINTPERFDKFRAMGADSCDGSGISRFSWMRERIAGGNGLFKENSDEGLERVSV